MLDVGLVQINNSFSGQNYLPYSVGTLQAYAQAKLEHPEQVSFRLPIYKRILVDDAVAQLAGADAVFFSTYVWNERISLEISRRLRLASPETVIVFGGPQVPDRSEDFLREHRHIDIAAHGEGELIFTALLEALPGRSWDGVAGISYLEGEAFHTAPKPPRLKGLDDVPSPYLDGTFAELMRVNPDERWIVTWETNRGCPFSCTFCDWGSATATKVNRFELERLKQELEWFADNRIEFIFCADANFGLLPRDLDLAQHAADTKARTGYPHALSVQNTKNATERAYQVQTVLAQAGLNKGVAISLQSTSTQTLEAIKRDNISSNSYAELQRRFTRDGVETYSDLILGLPGETYDSFVNGVADLIEGGQHNRIQFNNLSILPNAEMGDPEYQRKYGMEIIETDVVNIHGSLSSAEEVVERQLLVIGTNTLPKEDWARVRAFSWMAALLYFDKVLQIPLTVVARRCEVGYRELLEHFMSPAMGSYPVLNSVRQLFLREAAKIQAGGAEYVQSPEWLNIWWPADEYALIDLCARNRIDPFYEEALQALQAFVEARGAALPEGLLEEAVQVNHLLLKLPGQREDLELSLAWDLPAFYYGVLRGEEPELRDAPTRYRVDRTTKTWDRFEDWCREVIWWGNKKGAYLHGAEPDTSQLAGHF